MNALSAVTIDVRPEHGAQLRAYARLLPLGVRELDEELGREAADNPWLEIVDRPLLGLGTGAIDALASVRPSLEDHLNAALDARKLDPDVLCAARHVVGLLDAHAYLRDGVATICRLAAVTEAVAMAAIAAVQALEPAGVAARSLGERFRMQLADRASTCTLAFEVAGELDALAAQGAAEFASSRTIEPERLAAALEELRSCDPDPTRDFGTTPERVFPEIVFERDEQRIVARTDGRFLPDIRLATLDTSQGLSEPMRRARARARLVVDALARRRTTLERLAIVLLARQPAFLAGRGNVRDLHPLSGRDLARELGCAESTVSRAIADRYAATPFGVLPLRAFLAKRPGNIGLTTAVVRERIREVVVRTPHLSDEGIARTLKLSGIRLARRTVAKYRREIGLPSLRGRMAR